ncbi:hypothetical protein U1Q18_022882, partial [Sarracenia purpurea var. burkii]
HPTHSLQVFLGASPSLFQTTQFMGPNHDQADPPSNFLPISGFLTRPPLTVSEGLNSELGDEPKVSYLDNIAKVGESTLGE